MDKDKTLYYFEEALVLKSIVNFSIPAMVTMLVAIVYNLVDTAIGEIELSNYPVLRHMMAIDYTKPESYAYTYYINAQGQLIELSFSVSNNTLENQAKFNAIVSTLKMV